MGNVPFTKDGTASGVDPLLERLEEMEDGVKDAILTGATEDGVLDKLISITMRMVVQDRHIAQNPLEEPAFFARYFKGWVAAGMKELDAARSEQKKLEEEIAGVA